MRKEAIEDLEEGMVVEIFTGNIDFVGTVTRITDSYIELIIQIPLNDRNQVKEVIARIDLVSIDAIIIHSGAKVKENE
ncbi:hypothetical protein A77 [Sulfolobus turreted icosahedral virus 1]|uniref:Uncharacterized protein n=1 Tax=Sulfolobus turreted icosahedral virus 1 TaxID=269145 RepID=Q6Q0J4_9VIRU|nr:hypothetical protein A77 [Sulfolobus turreted icosahedral virus 1]AAS89097.1 hypothetical protein A77 [Sulfolobus turreted icosahedral virus 1]